MLQRIPKILRVGTNFSSTLIQEKTNVQPKGTACSFNYYRIEFHILY